MPRMEDMDLHAVEKFMMDNYHQSKSFGHYVHVGQTPYKYSKDVSCLRCHQTRCDVKFDGETEDHGRRKNRTKNHVQYCPSCHSVIQPTRYSTRETARGGSGINGMRYHLVDDSKASLMPSTIKQTQSSTLSPRIYSQCCPETVPHHRSKKGWSSRHRQMRRNDQEKSSSVPRHHSNMADNNVEEQHGFTQAGPIKSSLDKDVRKKSHQKTRNDAIESDRESECSCDCPQDSECSLSDSDKFKEQNHRMTEIGSEHQTEARVKRQYAGDEQDHSRRRTVHLATKYAEIKNMVQRMVREKNIEPMDIKNGKKTERNFKIPSKVATAETSDCEQDEQKQEQVEKELSRIPYCGHFEPSMMFPMHECKQVKELEESLEAGRTDISYEKESKEKEEENYIVQKNEIDLDSMKNHILVLIDKVLSKAFSDVKKNDVTKQEEIQQTVFLEISRLLQGDYCKPLAQSTVGHPTADCIKQLKKLRFDFLKHIQDEIRKLYNLEMFLDNCSPRQSLPIANSQSTNLDQQSDDRQQQQGQQQQMQQQQQQQQMSQEQQLSPTTANGLGKKMPESVL